MITTLLSAANWPIVGQIAWLMGKLMNFIYNFLDKTLTTDTGLVGLSMIIYTVFVYTCMLPLTISQQKTAKMNAVMQPEIQAVQKKYKNKKDQASMMKQQEEIQQVYDKYGTGMLSSCLPLLIQMPFLFALYPVILNIKQYVPAIKEAPDAVNKFLTIPNITISPLEMIKNSGSFEFPAIVIIITALALPAISGITQYISTILMQAASKSPNGDDSNPMASTMKSMNIMMPLMSVFIVFSSPSAIGIYWVISAVVRLVQQLLVNKHFSKISVEDIIEKNKEKAEKKREKRGERADKVSTMAQTNTRSLKDKAQVNTKATTSKKEVTTPSEETKVETKADSKPATDSKPGSLSDKANLVKRFNENK